jgi:hypothetical protein
MRPGETTASVSRPTQQEFTMSTSHPRLPFYFRVASAGLLVTALAPLTSGAAENVNNQRDNLGELSVTRLIDAFQDEEYPIGIDWHREQTTGFLPVDKRGNGRASQRASKAPIMAELVHRGVEALPDLLDHLTDARPSKHTVSVPRHGVAWFSVEYEPRDPRSEKPSAILDTLRSRPWFGTHGRFQRYTLRVGDFCFVAVGQIVSRNLCAVRGQPTACMVVNSPVESPALADAVRADWSGLTAAEHERVLRHQAEDPTDPYAPTALTRLIYYYPAAGKPLAVRLLNRPLYDLSLTGSFLNETLIPAAPDQHGRLLQQFRARHGEVQHNGLLSLLLERHTAVYWPDPEKDRAKKVCREILARFFPTGDARLPGFVNAASDFDQQVLVKQLSAQRVPGLDETIYRLFLRAVAFAESGIKVSDNTGLIYACAERLSGKGYDASLRASVRRCIRLIGRDVLIASAKDAPKALAAQVASLKTRVNVLKTLLDRLNRSKPEQS